MVLTGARISVQEQGWLEFLAKLRYTEAFWPGDEIRLREPPARHLEAGQETCGEAASRVYYKNKLKRR